MEMGQAIRHARKSCGLSQMELCAKAGISRSALVGLEKGSGSMRSLRKIQPIIGFRIAGLAGIGELHNQIREARQRRAWSLGKMSEKANISIPTIMLIERGGGNVTSFSKLLAALAPRARPAGFRREKWVVQKDVRLTPPDLLQTIRDVCGPIDLDPCSSPASFVNAKRNIYEPENGLTSLWSGSLAYVNPPFSDLARWMDRCATAIDREEVEKIVALFPARTETEPFRKRIFGVADVLLLPRRMSFFTDDGRKLPPSPHSLMLCIWGFEKKAVSQLRERLEANVIWSNPSK